MKRNILKEKFKKKNNGFTLMEVIMAIAVISVIIVLFSNIIAVSLKGRNKSRERLQMLACSTSLLDEITARQAEWKNIEGLKEWLISSSGRFTKIREEENAYEKVETGINDEEYNLNISIKPITDPYINNMLQIDLLVKPIKGSDIFLVLRLREVE